MGEVYAASHPWTTLSSTGNDDLTVDAIPIAKLMVTNTATGVSVTTKSADARHAP